MQFAIVEYYKCYENRYGRSSPVFLLSYDPTRSTQVRYELNFMLRNTQLQISYARYSRETNDQIDEANWTKIL